MSRAYSTFVCREHRDPRLTYGLIVAGRGPHNRDIFTKITSRAKKGNVYN